MDVRVEDISTVKKKIYVELPESMVTQEINSVYNDLKRDAKIKGYRPGKAPRAVLERLYHKNVNADVASKLIQDSFSEALKQADLHMIGDPDINPTELEPKTPYKYDAVVEIRPEIADLDYKGIKINKTMHKMSEEEVDSQLKMIQKNMAQLKTLEEVRPVEENDYAMIDYEGLKDGKPFSETQKTENFVTKIGQAQIIKDFDNQIIGMLPDQSKEFDVTFPEDYFNKNLAGLTINFKVDLKEIKQEILPDIDDEFAKDLGSYETLEDLKNDIRKNLSQGYEKRIEQELNEQIFTALLEKAEFEVPDTLIDWELEGILTDIERAYESNNITMEQLGQTREILAQKYRETAEKQVRRYLILNKIITQEKMEVSDPELEEAYAEVSGNVNQPVEQIKEFYSRNPDKLDLFKHTLLEKKAIKLILESSEITEVEPKAQEEEQKA